MSHRKSDLGIPRPRKSAKVVLESRNRLGNPSGDLAVVWTSVDVWTKPSATCRFRRDSNALQCADGRLLPWSGDVPVGSLEQARQAELAF